MIGLNAGHRYYLYKGPTDMRKGFDGLSGVIRDAMGRDPQDGSVYIFINRRRDRMKLLIWEAGGFMLYYKRLEQGTFELPRKVENDKGLAIEWETLMLMLYGISLEKIIRRKRYRYAS